MAGRNMLGVSLICVVILAACGEDTQPAFETPSPPTEAPTTSTTTTIAAVATQATTTTTTQSTAAPPTTVKEFCPPVDTPTTPLVTAQVGDLDGDELPEGIAVFDNEDGSGLLLISSTTQGPIAMQLPQFAPNIYTEASITGADIDKNGDIELFFPVRIEGAARIDHILEPGDCALVPVQLNGSPFELVWEDSGRRKALFRCGNGTVVTVTGPANGAQSTATVFQVTNGVVERRYEFPTDANVSQATGVGQRCQGVANQGPAPRRAG